MWTDEDTKFILSEIKFIQEKIDAVLDYMWKTKCQKCLYEHLKTNKLSECSFRLKDECCCLFMLIRTLKVFSNPIEEFLRKTQK